LATYFANMIGSEEVPPVPSRAYGTADFRLSGDGTRLHYTLSVHNILDATEAHIHLGRRGTNGPVVAYLFGHLCKGITLETGVITGTLTHNDLRGPLAGHSMASLLNEMNRGNTYANVHTQAHPKGEIRGQVRRTS
jgi:hypothetical protein